MVAEALAIRVAEEEKRAQAAAQEEAEREKFKNEWKVGKGAGHPTRGEF